MSTQDKAKQVHESSKVFAEKYIKSIPNSISLEEFAKLRLHYINIIFNVRITQ